MSYQKNSNCIHDDHEFYPMIIEGRKCEVCWYCGKKKEVKSC